MSVSSPWFVFKGDDIAVGAEHAIFSVGQRRVLVRPLTQQDSAALSELSRKQCIAANTVSPGLARHLLGQYLLTSSDQPQAATRVRPGSMASHRVVAIVRWVWPRPDSLFASPASLIRMALLSLGIVLAWWSGRPLPDLPSIARWFATAPFLDLQLVSAAVFLAAIGHEYGHAAACYRYSGTCGTIRITHYRGLPAIATDVSAIHTIVDRREKAMVAAAGPIAQAWIGLLFLAVPDERIRLAGMLTLLGAAFVFMPMPMSDGYWLLRDLFNLSLRPTWRRSTGRHWCDLVYGWSLTIATLALAAVLLSMFARFLGELQSARYLAWERQGLLVLCAAYALIVAMQFVYRNLQFVHQEICP